MSNPNRALRRRFLRAGMKAKADDIAQLFDRVTALDNSILAQRLEFNALVATLEKANVIKVEEKTPSGILMPRAGMIATPEKAK